MIYCLITSIPEWKFPISCEERDWISETKALKEFNKYLNDLNKNSIIEKEFATIRGGARPPPAGARTRSELCVGECHDRHRVLPARPGGGGDLGASPGRYVVGKLVVRLGLGRRLRAAGTVGRRTGDDRRAA